MHSNGQTNWIEVDLEAIRHNVRRLMDITGVQIMAVVKANAYGHGLVEASRAAVEAGATWLGVARIDEALALTRAGIPARTIVLGYTEPERAAEAAAEGVRLAVYDCDVVEAYSRGAQEAGRTLWVHAKFDTGMGRLGHAPEDGVEFIRRLTKTPGLGVEGAFTHLAEADEPEKPTTMRQLARFDALLESLNAAGLRPGVIHAANSAGTLGFPQARYDLVRPGIFLYGGTAITGVPSLQPVVRLDAKVIQVSSAASGETVGYGAAERLKRDSRLATVHIGYADGLFRAAGSLDGRKGAQAVVAGRRCPLVGRISMDLATLDITDLPEDAVTRGDFATFLGDGITVDELAAKAGTIGYEVLTSLGRRYVRRYIGG